MLSLFVAFSLGLRPTSFCLLSFVVFPRERERANTLYNIYQVSENERLLALKFDGIVSAYNSENGQMCAMKEVRVTSDDQNSNECLKQLNQEIALLSELSHPNIVQYYGSKLGVDNLSVYLEFVSGGSIHKLLSEYGSQNR